MEIKTKYLGIIKIEKEEIIGFPAGIPGFLEEKEYVILQEKEKTGPFMWLVSTKDMGTSFVITDPRNFLPNYTPEVSEYSIQELKLEKEEDALLYVILTIPEELGEMTANLRAPIIINGKKAIGKQVVLEESEYLVKHQVFKYSKIEVEKREKAVK